MLQGILGKKLGMTQIYSEDGKVIPVTIIEAGPCSIMQVKTDDSDGYSAIQLGFQDKKVSKSKNRRHRRALKPQVTQAEKIGTTAKQFVREVRWDGDGEYEPGKDVTVEAMEGVEYVDVVGTSKGRGFTGVMKRYNFKGGQATHGQHNRDRHGGAIGQATWPGRVFKGVKMPGHFGVDRITVQNLKLVSIDKEKNLLAIRGAVPGHNGAFVIVKKALKK